MAGGVFWDDLAEDLKDPEMRDHYSAASELITAADSAANPTGSALSGAIFDASCHAGSLTGQSVAGSQDRPANAAARCPRCSNYPQICGHDLPLKDRLKSLHTDTSWMANAGSHGRSDGD